MLSVAIGASEQCILLLRAIIRSFCPNRTGGRGPLVLPPRRRYAGYTLALARLIAESRSQKREVRSTCGSSALPKATGRGRRNRKPLTRTLSNCSGMPANRLPCQ
jgi:hypothetical protein